jgi:hypothetical protein
MKNSGPFFLLLIGAGVIYYLYSTNQIGTSAVAGVPATLPVDTGALPFAGTYGPTADTSITGGAIIPPGTIYGPSLT